MQGGEEYLVPAVGALGETETESKRRRGEEANSQTGR